MRIILIALALSACATRAPVNIAVPVPCIDAADIPSRPAALPQPIPDDARTALRHALAKLAEWTGYGERADIILSGCATP